jgi:uncharacterized protein YoxC
MTPYEMIIAAVAVCNLILTLRVLASNKHKAGEARLNDLEAALRTRLEQHETRLTQLATLLDKVPTHDDLGDVYTELNKTTQAVSHLTGAVQQMDASLRLLMQQLIHRRGSD